MVPDLGRFEGVDASPPRAPEDIAATANRSDVTRIGGIERGFSEFGRIKQELSGNYRLLGRIFILEHSHVAVSI